MGDSTPLALINTLMIKPTEANESLCEVKGGLYKLNCGPVSQVAVWSSGGALCTLAQAVMSSNLGGFFFFSFWIGCCFFLHPCERAGQSRYFAHR